MSTTYAIVKLNGKQFKVSQGETLVLDRVDHKVDQEFETDEVLFTQTKDQTQVGQPLVKGATIKFKVLDHFLGKKIRVGKFKAKSRYRRVKGHRQPLSKLEVTKISL